MNSRFCIFTFMAMALVSAEPAPAYAYAAPAVPMQVGDNTVRCGIDTMSDDAREIAMLLLFDAMTIAGGFTDTDQYKEAAVLIAEPVDRCKEKWGWSAAKSDAASSYAEFELVRQCIGQLLGMLGKDAAHIDAYFAENRVTLGDAAFLSSRHYAALDATLAEKGWEGEDVLNISHVYLDMLWTQETLTRKFDRQARR